ncbi:peptidoglycan editing factor PgeF [Hydrogenophaga sp.]|uniref:peptidoglycan editing factor PgeF n=1 Tax=Hydrogenophaga sp. TaxID=1904254 RepID=UPI002CE515A5|nr:peptidoglycan editing factor PgeF [Hydrogenophaga sp.]HMP10716.1 peptidoglycan editing factor PgeF [Hydrogenophaga sp.]
MGSFPSGWIVPEWEAADRVGAVFTTRQGGVSLAPFDDFNLGDHVGDDAAAVATNRLRLTRSIGVRPVFLSQVHGCDVAALDEHTRDGVEADACVATSAGGACTGMVADCLPVLLADRHGQAVAAAHAGWRGLAAGVLEEAVNALRKTLISAGGAPGDVVAWLGPCIGPQAFEVGEEVRQAFVSADSRAAAAFRPQGQGKYLADLALLARHRLQALEIGSITGNDGTARWCTVSQSSRFFSHRRDARVLGSSGRMAACVWLR